MLTILALSLAPVLLDPLPQGGKRSALRERIAELYASRDRAGCVALWRENAGIELPTIDQDLEGSLKIEETAKEPDRAKIALMRGRAVWCAICAAEAIGNPMIVDYAASFAGWNEAQKKFFREEQAIYRKAMGHLEKSENSEGRMAAQECVQRALLLGDWWGAAMGYEASATAHQALSSFEDALAAWSHGRVLYHDLGMVDSELGCLRAMADMCTAVERPLRGREVVEQALAVVRKRGDKAAQVELLARRASFEEKLGDKAAAEGSRKEAEGLRP